jgi:hypothetical protein
MEAGLSRMDVGGIAIMGGRAIMSDRAWMVFIMSAFGFYFIIAAITVKTFRYKYGGFRVSRLVGGIVYAGVGIFCFWVALVLALKR